MKTDLALFSEPQLKQLRQKLLAWYQKNKRVMPWRATDEQTPNPYHVLLSEIMLQQTQVATVIDYFNRFIAAFPTVDDLASAQEQEVLNLWQGLGYYRRARNLHAAAKMIVAQHQSSSSNCPASVHIAPAQSHPSHTPCPRRY